MILLGLTGGMGMGKTTTASLFASEGAAVYDADAAVHDLYRAGGPAGPLLALEFPTAVTLEGEVRRDRLKSALSADPDRLAILEGLVFPLLASRRARFLDQAREDGRTLAVLDVPLLFETQSEMDVDAVVVVTASEAVQRERVLRERGVDPDTFDLLMTRQLGDAERRRRADFVIFTDRGMDAAAADVRAVVAQVLAPGWRGRR